MALGALYTKMNVLAAVAALTMTLIAVSPVRANADDPSRPAPQRNSRSDMFFPTRAKAAGDLLRERAAAGAYDGETKDALAAVITADLATVLHDKHVHVFYSEEVLPAASASGDRSSPAERAEEAAFERSIGFGVQRTAHLPGDVGYIDLRIFAETKPARDRVIDGLADSVAYSDAVILDLRQNHGGDPDAVARLLSHFLPLKTHLNDFVGRGDGNAKVASSTYTGKVEGPVITAPLYI